MHVGELSELLNRIGRRDDWRDGRGVGRDELPGGDGHSRRYGWRDHGAIVVATDGETVAAVSEMLAPEQLGVQTAEDEGYHWWLRNYGWIFLGFRATVAFSDTDVTGTNQVLPTGHAARYTGGGPSRAC